MPAVRRDQRRPAALDVLDGRHRRADRRVQQWAAAVAAEAVAAVTELTRVDELRAFGEVVAGCTKCALAGGRTQVVFGSGNPDSDLMFVGEAPGFHEDKQGVPFVGAAGKLLDQLLADIGLDA